MQLVTIHFWINYLVSKEKFNLHKNFVIPTKWSIIFWCISILMFLVLVYFLYTMTAFVRYYDKLSIFQNQWLSILKRYVFIIAFSGVWQYESIMVWVKNQQNEGMILLFMLLINLTRKLLNFIFKKLKLIADKCQNFIILAMSDIIQM